MFSIQKFKSQFEEEDKNYQQRLFDLVRKQVKKLGEPGAKAVPLYDDAKVQDFKMSLDKFIKIVIEKQNAADNINNNVLSGRVSTFFNPNIIGSFNILFNMGSYIISYNQLIAEIRNQKIDQMTKEKMKTDLIAILPQIYALLIGIEQIVSRLLNTLINTINKAQDANTKFLLKTLQTLILVKFSHDNIDDNAYEFINLNLLKKEFDDYVSQLDSSDRDTIMELLEDKQMAYNLSSQKLKKAQDNINKNKLVIDQSPNIIFNKDILFDDEVIKDINDLPEVEEADDKDDDKDDFNLPGEIPESAEQKSSPVVIDSNLIDDILDEMDNINDYVGNFIKLKTIKKKAAFIKDNKDEFKNISKSLITLLKYRQPDVNISDSYDKLLMDMFILNLKNMKEITNLLSSLLSDVKDEYYKEENVEDIEGVEDVEVEGAGMNKDQMRRRIRMELFKPMLSYDPSRNDDYNY